MLSYLQYLLALVIGTHGLTPPDAPAPAPDVLGIVLTLSAFGLVWSAIGVLTARRLPEDPDRAVPRFLRMMTLGRVVTLAVYWFVAQTLQAKDLPHTLGIAHWILVPHLIRFVPFGVLLILLRTGLHPVGLRLQLEPPSLPATWRLELSEALLPLGPLLPLLAVWDLVFLAAPGTFLGAAGEVFVALPVAQAALALGLLFAALVAMPFVLRFAWRARPLEPGPLRDRLEAYARSVNLRAREMLVWPTGGTVMNAAVVGAFPRFRYVFLTDGLVETLGHDEIEAVFAHEAGHARRGHVLLFFGFTAVLVLSSLLPDALGISVPGPSTELGALARSVAMLLVWVGVVFGWISRRFEQEADVFGIDTLPCPQPTAGAQHPFARALDRIAEDAGGIREITGWRHFSIADRVAFVEEYVADPAVRARYRRSIGLLRGTLISVLAVFACLAAARVPAEIATGRAIWEAARTPGAQLLRPLHDATAPAPARLRARAFLDAATLAQRADHADAALRWLRSAAALAPDDPLVLAAYAQALADGGRPVGAALVWRRLRELPGVPEPLRERAAAALAELAPAHD